MEQRRVLDLVKQFESQRLSTNETHTENLSQKPIRAIVAKSRETPENLNSTVNRRWFGTLLQKVETCVNVDNKIQPLRGSELEKKSIMLMEEGESGKMVISRKDSLKDAYEFHSARSSVSTYWSDNEQDFNIPDIRITELQNLTGDEVFFSATDNELDEPEVILYNNQFTSCEDIREICDKYAYQQSECKEAAHFGSTKRNCYNEDIKVTTMSAIPHNLDPNQISVNFVNDEESRSKKDAITKAVKDEASGHSANQLESDVSNTIDDKRKINSKQLQHKIQMVICFEELFDKVINWDDPEFENIEAKFLEIFQNSIGSNSEDVDCDIEKLLNNI